jgi:hypothetical protein
LSSCCALRSSYGRTGRPSGARRTDHSSCPHRTGNRWAGGSYRTSWSLRSRWPWRSCRRSSSGSRCSDRTRRPDGSDSSGGASCALRSRSALRSRRSNGPRSAPLRSRRAGNSSGPNRPSRTGRSCSPSPTASFSGQEIAKIQRRLVFPVFRRLAHRVGLEKERLHQETSQAKPASIPLNDAVVDRVIRSSVILESNALRACRIAVIEPFPGEISSAGNAPPVAAAVIHICACDNEVYCSPRCIGEGSKNESAKSVDRTRSAANDRRVRRP